MFQLSYCWTVCKNMMQNYFYKRRIDPRLQINKIEKANVHDCSVADLLSRDIGNFVVSIGHSLKMLSFAL